METHALQSSDRESKQDYNRDLNNIPNACVTHDSDELVRVSNTLLLRDKRRCRKKILC
jgi:hypothetical protein